MLAINMNDVKIGGRLTADMEIRYTNDNKPVGRFSLAFDRSYKGKDGWVNRAGFIKIKVLGEMANYLSNQIGKGSPVIISGKLDIFEFDGKDGNKIKGCEIIAFMIYIIEKNKTITSEEIDHSNNEETETITDDDVPF